MLERTVDTQFGTLVLREEQGALVRLTWGRAASDGASDVLEAAARQLSEYAAGQRETFDLPLAVGGSDLQRAVCAQMQAIPFGHTVTYGDIAKALDVPAQAVGQACGANPIAIVIPCHRVMGAKGLTGFSGGQGVETKVALLRHEKAGGFLI
ncbi:MAG: methylated-DNA--[protein]-cysteine S-methyltransferase [Pseudomonadota bacterium]